MKELEVTIRVRNNRLKERRLAMGLTQREFAEIVGCSANAYTALENMSASPLRTGKRVGFGPGSYYDGTRWRDIATELAQYYGVTEDELFPEAVVSAEEVVAVRKVDANELPALMSDHEVRRLTESPGDVVARDEVRELLHEAMADLTPVEANVLHMRFGIGENSDHTLDEVGRVLGKSRERIRQIEERALRKLRRRPWPAADFGRAV